MLNFLNHNLIKPEYATAKNNQYSICFITGLLSIVFGVVMLTGCGQKGALYLPEDAPSNTDFILHKANKPQSPNNSDRNDNSQESPIEDADISADPQDY